MRERLSICSHSQSEQAMAAFKTWCSSSSAQNICSWRQVFLVFLGWALVAPAALAGSEYDLFPLLMPKVTPTHEESYLCTPIKMSEDETYYVKGFQPNATGHTAHHMLIYGCDAPGSADEPVWNCGRCCEESVNAVCLVLPFEQYGS